MPVVNVGLRVDPDLWQRLKFAKDFYQVSYRFVVSKIIEEFLADPKNVAKIVYSPPDRSSIFRTNMVPHDPVGLSLDDGLHSRLLAIKDSTSVSVGKIINMAIEHHFDNGGEYARF